MDSIGAIVKKLLDSQDDGFMETVSFEAMQEQAMVNEVKRYRKY